MGGVSPEMFRGVSCVVRGSSRAGEHGWGQTPFAPFANGVGPHPCLTPVDPSANLRAHSSSPCMRLHSAAAAGLLLALVSTDQTAAAQPASDAALTARVERLLTRIQLIDG